MTVSTDGQICFGILLEEDYYPWDEYGGEFEYWYYKSVLGFKPTMEIYDEGGDLLPGVTEEQENNYWAEWSEFRDKYSCPYELVNACSYDSPVHILAIAETVKSASCGYPEIFDPEELSLSTASMVAPENFCKEFGIKTVGKSAWYLSSFWG